MNTRQMTPTEWERHAARMSPTTRDAIETGRARFVSDGECLTLPPRDVQRDTAVCWAAGATPRAEPADIEAEIARVLETEGESDDLDAEIARRMREAE